MNLVKYVVDVVVESNEGKKDFQELLQRIEVFGRSKAVETLEEADWYMTNVAKKEASVFMYRAEKAPTCLVQGKKVQVK